MNNVIKILAGTALGAGVGAAVSKLLEARAGVELEITGPDGVARVVDADAKPGIGDRVKARLDAARLAGEEAKAAKEAELRGYFREKVNDPTAMAVDPLAPPRREG